MRKNITVSIDTLEDLKDLSALLKINHSKLIAVALKMLKEKVHGTVNEQLELIYPNIAKKLISKLN